MGTLKLDSKGHVFSKLGLQVGTLNPKTLREVKFSGVVPGLFLEMSGFEV